MREGGLDRGSLAAGIFFVLAGTMFLLDELSVLSLRARYLWPLLLIAFGIAMLAGAGSPSHGGKE
ncbi:MAG: DUF5668 domain-containing protein [Actinomycetota bacterium]